MVGQRRAGSPLKQHWIDISRLLGGRWGTQARPRQVFVVSGAWLAHTTAGWWSQVYCPARHTHTHSPRGVSGAGRRQGSQLIPARDKERGALTPGADPGEIS